MIRVMELSKSQSLQHARVAGVWSHLAGVAWRAVPHRARELNPHHIHVSLLLMLVTHSIVFACFCMPKAVQAARVRSLKVESWTECSLAMPSDSDSVPLFPNLCSSPALCHCKGLMLACNFTSCTAQPMLKHITTHSVPHSLSFVLTPYPTNAALALPQDHVPHRARAVGRGRAHGGERGPI